MRWILLLLLTSPLYIFGQECDCLENFHWIKKTFEENDAGFQFSLENKGVDNYEEHTAKILSKVKAAKTVAACGPILYEWLTFFRSGHIAIRLLNNTNGQNASNESNPDAIREKFADWENASLNLASFKKYLDQSMDPYEGIWSSPPYLIGIKKYGEEYKGSIIQADSIYWLPGQVKLRFAAGDNGNMACTFYMRDHSPEHFDEVKLLGKNYMKTGFIHLKRSYPIYEPDEHVERYFELINTNRPFAKRLSEESFLLRIPTFNYGSKPLIDSVIDANRADILATRNLILDIRNNGGGSDSSYDKLIPFLYTNPIRIVGVQLLSTPLNNSRMLKFSEDPNWDEEGRKWAAEAYEKLNARIGELVDLDSNMVDIQEQDTVYPYPENVGILINRGNGSTSEQFLLAAKQSTKVKLFGTTTVGVLDVSNMHFVPTPDGNFELGYSLSISHRIPDMAIDDKGIMPDYYLGKGIEDHEWVDYVLSIYER